MSARVVRNQQDLLAMLRQMATEHPLLAKEISSMIRLAESDHGLADELIQAMASAGGGWKPEEGAGFFNLNSLSSLPFLAVTLTQIRIPSLLRRTKIYGDAIGNVEVIITPDDELIAKACDNQCRISLGLLNVFFCVCQHLFCLEEKTRPEGGWCLATEIPRVREKLFAFLGLNIKAEIAREYVDENFRSDHYRKFTETNEVLSNLGIESNIIDACLQSGKPENIVIADVFASLCIRFIVLHEIAHFHYGHSQLLQLWREEPELAERTMAAGFPSPEARRAMESFADAWATEMLLVTETFSDSAHLSNEIFDCRLTPRARATAVLFAVELTFQIFSAVDSVSQDINAALEDFLAALRGTIQTMYPGAGSRAAYAIHHGVKRAARNHPYLRWTRWWTMKKDLLTIDSRIAGELLFKLWPACGLGGGMVPVIRPGYKYSPPTRNATERMTSSGEEDSRLSWHPWDRFDYVKAHEHLLPDLIRAKKWATKDR